MNIGPLASPRKRALMSRPGRGPLRLGKAYAAALGWVTPGATITAGAARRNGDRVTDRAVLIVASGRGVRFGAGGPKQYRPLLGRPLLRYSLERFSRHPRISRVRAVIHEDDHVTYQAAAAGLRLMAPVCGGPTRQDSVRLGLESLEDTPPDQVLIHDGVRPLVSDAVIDRVIDALDRTAAALPALPVTDSLRRGEAGRVRETVERAGLFRAQTPQGFAFGPILDAHRAHAGAAMTDDAAIAAGAGLEVALVEGDEANLKITEPRDLGHVMRLMAGAVCSRTGLGFDVHRLVPGERITLLGVDLPWHRRLTGHSDADVGLHALTDAILGTLGAGDIGTHFPPGEARWAGANSAVFVEHARDLVLAAGGWIEHVDVTLICEAPRIGPHRAAMVRRLADLLRIEPVRVSVKATTTERLGFTGRGEGIAAQALATVALPR
jgi:2-C-methyl-D-erythritol 4-phosphate cytidylyltransferase/2-C-methyl-D-erythritol 2,4-cyclodiphosphate synthase